MENWKRCKFGYADYLCTNPNDLIWITLKAEATFSWIMHNLEDSVCLKYTATNPDSIFFKFSPFSQRCYVNICEKDNSIMLCAARNHIFLHHNFLKWVCISVNFHVCTVYNHHLSGNGEVLHGRFFLWRSLSSPSSRLAYFPSIVYFPLAVTHQAPSSLAISPTSHSKLRGD